VRRIIGAAVIAVIVVLMIIGRLGESTRANSSSSSSSLTGTKTAEYQTLCGPNPVSWSVDASGREIYSCDGKAWWRK
jgi:hypothetical protein